MKFIFRLHMFTQMCCSQLKCRQDKTFCHLKLGSSGYRYIDFLFTHAESRHHLKRDTVSSERNELSLGAINRLSYKKSVQRLKAILSNYETIYTYKDHS